MLTALQSDTRGALQDAVKGFGAALGAEPHDRRGRRAGSGRARPDGRRGARRDARHEPRGARGHGEGLRRPARRAARRPGAHRVRVRPGDARAGRAGGAARQPGERLQHDDRDVRGPLGRRARHGARPRPRPAPPRAPRSRACARATPATRQFATRPDREPAGAARRRSTRRCRGSRRRRRCSPTPSSAACCDELQPATADLAALGDATRRWLPRIDAFDRCVTEVLLPTGERQGRRRRAVGGRRELQGVLVRDGRLRPARARASTATARCCGCRPRAAPDIIKTGKTNYQQEPYFGKPVLPPLRTTPGVRQPAAAAAARPAVPRERGAGRQRRRRRPGRADGSQPGRAGARRRARSSGSARSRRRCPGSAPGWAGDERPLRERVRAVVMIAVLVLLAAVVSLYILANQNLTGPSWMPVIGKDHFRIDARFTSAAGVLPGQGQAVTISGVRGRRDRRRDGSRTAAAVLTLDIERRFAQRATRRDAAAAAQDRAEGHDRRARPRDAGERARCWRRAPRSAAAATQPDVNFEEILASLDTDTRTSLQLLLTDGGKALGDGGGTRAGEHVPALRAAVAPQRAGDEARRAAAQEAAAADAQPVADRRRARLARPRARHVRRRERRGLPPLRRPERAPRRGAGAAAAARWRRARPRSGSSTGSARRSRPGCATSRPAPKALGPTLRQVRPFLNDDDAGAARPAAPVRARGAADGAQARPGDARPRRRRRRSSPSSPTCSTRSSTSWPTTRRATTPRARATCSTCRGRATTRTRCCRRQDGVGPTRRSLVLFSCGSLQLFKIFALRRAATRRCRR